MDLESGKLNAGRDASRLPKIFLAASTILSCLAVAGVLLLVLQNYNHEAEVRALQKVPQKSRDDTLKMAAQREVRDMIESHLRMGRETATSTNYNCPHSRRTPFHYRDCTDSPRTPGTVPSAHIVPDSSKSLCYVMDPGVQYYSNITVGWSCGSTVISPISFPGFVRGGMVFIRDTGELIVPVDGIYFVYSQVHVEVTNTTNMVLAGTQTIICPSQGRCRPTTSMLTEMLTDLTTEPFYHGGLFHLTANSTISIATFGRVNGTHVDSLAYKTYFANTFMGAFLVEEFEEESPEEESTEEESPEEESPGEETTKLPPHS